MAQQLITRARFAALCNMTPGGVTRACAGELLPAVSGKLVDVNHPVAVEYLARQTAPRPEPPAPGVDARYAEAVGHCRTTGRWSTSNIQHLGIGYTRAKRIFDSMQALGVVPAAAPPPVKMVVKPPRPTRSEARHAKKKAEAWAAVGAESPAPGLPPSAPVPRDAFKSIGELATHTAAIAKALFPGQPAADDDLVEIPEDIQTFADMTLRELIERFGTDVRFVDWLGATQKIEAINEKRLKNAETEGRLISRELVKSAVLDRIDGVFVRMLTDGAKTIASRSHSMTAAGATVRDVQLMVEDQLGSFIRPAKTKMQAAIGDAPTIIAVPDE